MTMNEPAPYLAILEDVCRRAASATVAQSGLRSEAARRHLLDVLAAPPGTPGSFLADLVFEPAPVWEPAAPTLADLAAGLLAPELVEALDGAPENVRMPRDRRPYAHQLAAWQTALEDGGRSFMVTSGTGSGKTECFLIPILHDLLVQRRRVGRLEGVRAIVLYPLNALINSQKERLGNWIAPFDGDLRFALYKGDLPDAMKAADRRALPRHEVADRKSLREAPPSILVTNVTMLEYMLVRHQDASILAKSRGQLKWIVLDEAHSYVGAQAAEIALLLRRVRDAFGVGPEQTRLIATSATLGEGEKTREDLRRFLADLAGQRPEEVVVIEGGTKEPALPPLADDAAVEPDALARLDDAGLWDKLAGNRRVRKVLDRLNAGDGVTLSSLVPLLAPGREGQDAKRAAFAVMDAAGRATSAEGLRLAPWRLHAFHRAQAGVWACADASCPDAASRLGPERDWPFGALYVEERERCACGAPVFEVVRCQECERPALLAEEVIVCDFVKLRQPTDRAPGDDYEIDVEPLDDEMEPPRAASRAVLLHVPGARRVVRKSCVVRDGTDDAAPDDLSISISRVEEPACCGGGTRPKPPRSMRFGAPFLLGNALPLLLGAAPPTVVQGEGPSRGRRLLSFTDSRQGTARFAAKLQQEAERNLTRATIYHAVQGGGGDADEIKALEDKIAKLRAVGSPLLEDMIRDEEAKLAKLTAPGGREVRWQELVDTFAKNRELADFATTTWDHHLRSDRAFADPTKLAELFLYRETFRRPRVQNNVETMGLAALAFPKLDDLIPHTVPRPMREAGLGADAWRDFLYLCIDFGLREKLAVDATRTVAHWASPSRSCGVMLPPGSSKLEIRWRHIWPLASTSADSRLIRILAHVLGADMGLPGDRDRIDACMGNAWDVLRRSKAIKPTSSPDEWTLDYKTAAFMPVDWAWQCPITRRVLARTVRGLTPYGFTRHHGTAVEATSVTMPRLPNASPVGLTPSRREAVAAWIEADPHIKELRARGVWSNLHDRVATFQPFLRAVEHSAQLDRQTLEGYEAGFKAGRINILNCSTTMEMGVDIANVGVVVNTNVPPAPANYRQRIGRAGRRGEPRALAFTFCKDAPLDRAVFREPQRLLGGAMLAPRVALDSAVIVQRHVNAFLLGHFLREKAHDWLFNMRIGEFFGVPDTLDGPRPSDVSSVFEDFLRAPGGLASPLPERLATIVRGSSLSNAPNLPARCADRLFEVRAAWMKERKAIEEAAQGFDSAGAAYKALDHRFRRLSREYLLGELARRGFLPSYGFPVDVVAFDAKARTKDDGFRRRESLFKAGPSRTLDIAIRDYAPGSDIVVDGLVYRSAGITPSWSLPTTTGSSTEDIRTAWRCGACDTFGVDNVPPPACDVCAAPIPHSFDCLRPAGFGGDQEPHASYESVAYVAPSEPWVTAKAGAWQAAPQPLRGRFRATHEGQVLVFSRGAENEGYALCLGCGRAEAEAAEGDGQRKPLKGHKPLYPAKHLLAQDSTCRAGSSRHGIKRNLALGYTFTTDVFEMQLVDPRGEDAAGIAFALGCALREALARRIGVEAEEMGVTTHRPDKGDGASHTGVLLHDKASGGAGFSPLAAPMLPGLLADAARILACPAECASGCSECIVRADVQYQAHQIDRRKAFTWLQGVLLNS